MPTTFHVVNFKNKTLNMLTGGSTVNPTSLAFINVYNGVQPADPSATPAGTPVFSSTSIALPINTFMTAAASGVSALTVQRAANASSTVNSLTFARIYDSSSQPMIDTTVGLSEGGVILDALSILIGNALTLKNFSLKLPKSNGTLSLSQSLVDRMVDLWTNNATAKPELGKEATIDLYDGSLPATPDQPASGNKLATFLGNAVSWFSAAAGGSCALASVPTTTASGTGTPTYFRWYKTVSNILFTIQGSVGTADTDMVISTDALTADVTSVSITEATLSI